MRLLLAFFLAAVVAPALATINLDNVQDFADTGLGCGEDFDASCSTCETLPEGLRVLFVGCKVHDAQLLFSSEKFPNLKTM